MWVTSNIIVAPSHSHSHSHSHHNHNHNHNHGLGHNPLLCPFSADPSPCTCPPPGRRESVSAVEKERMKMGRRRKWDWGAVLAKCALPAGVVYFVMAWVEVLRREFEEGRC